MLKDEKQDRGEGAQGGNAGVTAGRRGQESLREPAGSSCQAVGGEIPVGREGGALLGSYLRTNFLVGPMSF